MRSVEIETVSKEKTFSNADYRDILKEIHKIS